MVWSKPCNSFLRGSNKVRTSATYPCSRCRNNNPHGFDMSYNAFSVCLGGVICIRDWPEFQSYGYPFWSHNDNKGMVCLSKCDMWIARKDDGPPCGCLKMLRPVLKGNQMAVTLFAAGSQWILIPMILSALQISSMKWFTPMPNLQHVMYLNIATW